MSRFNSQSSNDFPYQRQDQSSYRFQSDQKFNHVSPTVERGNEVMNDSMGRFESFDSLPSQSQNQTQKLSNYSSSFGLSPHILSPKEISLLEKPSQDALRLFSHHSVSQQVLQINSNRPLQLRNLSKEELLSSYRSIIQSVSHVYFNPLIRNYYYSFLPQEFQNDFKKIDKRESRNDLFLMCGIFGIMAYRKIGKRYLWYNLTSLSEQKRYRRLMIYFPIWWFWSTNNSINRHKFQRLYEKNIYYLDAIYWRHFQILKQSGINIEKHFNENNQQQNHKTSDQLKNPTDPQHYPSGNAFQSISQHPEWSQQKDRRTEL